MERGSASLIEIQQKYGIRKNAVSLASSFLIDMGIIRNEKGDEKRIITDQGARLGRA